MTTRRGLDDHNFYRLALDVLGRAVIVLDDEGQVLYGNRRSEDLFGSDRAASDRLDVDRLFVDGLPRLGPPGATTDGSGDDVTLAGGRPVVERSLARCGDGRTIPVELASARFRLGDLSCTVVSVDERQTEDDLAAELRRCEAARHTAERAVARCVDPAMLQRASHYIQRVSLALHQASSRCTQDDVRTQIDDSLADLDRALKMVQQSALALARVTTASPPPDTLVRRVASDVRAETGITTTVAVDGDVRPMSQQRAEQLEAALGDLLRLVAGWSGHADVTLQVTQRIVLTISFEHSTVHDELTGHQELRIAALNADALGGHLDLRPAGTRGATIVWAVPNHDG